jgi:hypothetical protein
LPDLSSGENSNTCSSEFRANNYKQFPVSKVDYGRRLEILFSEISRGSATPPESIVVASIYGFCNFTTANLQPLT